MSSVQVRAGGYLLSAICRYSDLTYSFRRPYGCWEASLQVGVGARWRHPAFKRGNSFEIFCGGMRLWIGIMGDPDWETGTMTAKGLIRVGEDYRARVWDSTAAALVATWNPRAAVDDVISPAGASGRPAIGWRRDSSVPNVNLRPSTDAEPMQLLDLLDLATDRGYGTPYIGGDGRLRMLSDPTQVAWMAHPRVVNVGEAGGPERATRIFLTYMAASGLSWVDTTSYVAGNIVTFNGDLWERIGSGAGDIPEEGSSHWAQLEVEPWDPTVTSKTYSTGTHYTLKDGVFYKLVVPAGPDVTVAAPPGGSWTTLGSLPTETTLDVADASVTPYREGEEIDARSLGDLPTSEATAIANQALGVALAPAYTSDIPATPLTLTDAAGWPSNPLAVRPEKGLVRILGAAHPHLGQPFIDVIMGEVIVSDAHTPRPTALIKVSGKEPRGTLEVLQDALTALRRAS